MQKQTDVPKAQTMKKTAQYKKRDAKIERDANRLLFKFVWE